MALFKEFSDKRLTFVAQVRYHCLFLDDIKPRMLVFDKSVLRGDLMSLLGVVAQEDREAGAALASKRGKLKSASLQSDGKTHTLTFEDAVDPKAVHGKLRKLNGSLAGKLAVTVATEEAPKTTLPVRSRTTDDLPPRPREERPTGRSRSGTVVGVQVLPETSLLAVEKALEEWKRTYGDPPAPGTPSKAITALGKLREAADAWGRKFEGTEPKAHLLRARNVSESARVLTSRIELQEKKGEFREVNVKPILAWAWCSANVERGKLLDVLKAGLIPYERAVQAFHKAPGQTALDAAKKHQVTLVRALTGAQDHYQKKEGDRTKLNLTTALLADAQAQARVLDGLGDKLADLTPEACSRKGTTKLLERVPTPEKALEDHQTELTRQMKLLDSELETTRKTMEVDGPARARRDHAEALERIEKSELDEDQKQQSKKKEDEKLDQTLTKLAQLMVKRRQSNQATRVEATAAAAKNLALVRLDWEQLRKVLKPELPLFKALEKLIPAYGLARDALAKAATPTTHAAAWKALQAVEKAVAGAESALARLVTGGKTPELKSAAKDEVAFRVRLADRVRQEKSNLEAVEAELPQGKLASSLAESEEGRATLDAWVEELGGKASSEEDKAMVRTAMKARFKLDRLDGDMTTKALPKLYKILTMVPEGQTRDNEKLNRVERNQAAWVPGGFYNHDEKTKDGVISMNMPRTGASGVMKNLFGALLPWVEKPEGGWEGSGVKKSEAKIVFSHLTLHEVGHSVDEQLGFMDSHLGDSKYGNWVESSAEEVRELAGTRLKFYDALKDVKLKKGATPPTEAKTLANDEGARKEFLTRYLDLVLEGKDPSDDAKLKSSAEAFTVEWKALAAQEGAKVCKAARLNEGIKSEVTQWDSKAASARIGDRVYQESYADTWWSYDVNARKRGIGGYQFRAPGEWFSEIYACYYGGRLKSSHPDYAWMKALVDDK